jgi:multidrug efflux system membrane fusion protein
MRSPDGRVEVLSGLKGGESLVIRGAEALSNGVSVRVAGPGAAPAPAGKTGDTSVPPAKK